MPRPHAYLSVCALLLVVMLLLARQGLIPTLSQRALDDTSLSSIELSPQAAATALIAGETLNDSLWSLYFINVDASERFFDSIADAFVFDRYVVQLLQSSFEATTESVRSALTPRPHFVFMASPAASLSSAGWSWADVEGHTRTPEESDVSWLAAESKSLSAEPLWQEYKNPDANRLFGRFIEAVGRVLQNAEDSVSGIFGQ